MGLLRYNCTLFFALCAKKLLFGIFLFRRPSATKGLCPLDSRKPFEKGLILNLLLAIVMCLTLNLFLTTGIYAQKQKTPQTQSVQGKKELPQKHGGTTGKQKRRSSRLAGFCAILAHTCIHGTIFSSFYPDFTVGFGIGKRLTESATEEPPSFSGYTAGGETNPALKEKTKQRSESVQTRHVQILTAATRGAIFNKRQTPTAQSALNIERSIQHPEFCIQYSAFCIQHLYCRLRL